MLTPEEGAKIIQSMKAYRTGKLALHLMHGRDTVTEEMPDWGYEGPILFCDWMHITYNTHIGIGWGQEETGPLSKENGCIWFENEMIAINNDGVTQYYGDWEIVPAEELL